MGLRRLFKRTSIFNMELENQFDAEANKTIDHVN